MAVARRTFGTRRVGHTGTLDPFASGLLPLLVGRATRLMPYVVGLRKQYTGLIRLGVRTTTDDGTGDVVDTDDGWRALDDARIREAMQDLTGTLAQVPPAFSAKKLGGTPAHRRARRGEVVTLEPVSVVVYGFELTGLRGADLEFAAEVGSGTYLRALARDLGDVLGCGAHVATLRRTQVGPWRVEEAAPVSALADGSAVLADAALAVSHLPVRSLTPAEHDLVRHGRAIPAVAPTGGPVALLAEGRLVAVAEVRDAALAPKVVLEG